MLDASIITQCGGSGFLHSGISSKPVSLRCDGSKAGGEDASLVRHTRLRLAHSLYVPGKKHQTYDRTNHKTVQQRETRQGGNLTMASCAPLDAIIADAVLATRVKSSAPRLFHEAVDYLFAFNARMAGRHNP